MKQVIFNVGGALSTYTEFAGKKLMVDLGKSSDFHPILDFLLPLFEQRGDEKSTRAPEKFKIDQLLLSHPHNDHISGIEEFDDSFYAELLTCPNDNDGMDENDKINWDLLEDNPNIDILREMLIGRQPPLKVTSDQNEFIYYIPPKDVEESEELSKESYCNNISISVFLLINGSRVFLPGDMQKLGMEKLINYHHFLKNKLKGGVDILVVPHHGLRSSFSTILFDHMKNNKTKCINLVSEKANTNDNRGIDTRYSSSEYCSGINNLGDGENSCYQVKTSRGHILIDYSNHEEAHIEVISDTEELINRFIEL